MALTECKECQKQVSTEAPYCPHCGIEKPSTQTTETQQCSECGKPVSNSFQVCPNCGAPLLANTTASTPSDDDPASSEPDAPLSFHDFRRAKIEEDQSWGYAHYKGELRKAYKNYLEGQGLYVSDHELDEEIKKKSKTKEKSADEAAADQALTNVIGVLLIAALIGGFA